MSRWKRRLLILGFSIIALLILLLLAGFKGIPFIVDLWWFDAQGYGFYFWQRMLYQSVVFIQVGIVFFLIFFLNFWVASHYLGVERPADAPPGARRKKFKRLSRKFQTGSLWIYTPFSIVLSILIAWPLFQQWESFLLYLVAPETGIDDPTYDKDISYYLFSFPIYELLLERLLLAFLLLLIGLALLYWLENRLLSRYGKYLPNGVRWHLSILVLIILFIEIWDFILQRNGLVYSEVHQPLFFGPGFVEMRVILPFIWLSLIFLLGVALSFMLFVHKHKGLKLLMVFSLLFISSLGVRYFHFLHWATQEYIVEPNQLSLEKPFIENSIEATLEAYKLDKVKIREFDRERVLEDIANAKVQDLLRNIPLWNKELVGQTYLQLQRLRTYYDFPAADVDRYLLNGRKQQVFLASRELNYENLPSGAKKWVNEHLLYTHGYGVVMTSAGQGEGESMDWFIREIPPEAVPELDVEQPAIYYGLGSYRYAIAPNENGELHYPQGDSNVMTNYQGRGGVDISSLFRKMVFAHYFSDSDIFFTAQTIDESKILFRRNIVERIERLTPYLFLDADPYLVLTSKGLYWIQDAYTVSKWYPNADRIRFMDSNFPFSIRGDKDTNYIRNSVKIVVDAYHGTVDYYIFDASDPIIQAYSKIYPGLFKARAQMPADILSHVRYPKDLFEIQMGIYAKYHQTDVEVFYQQEDKWSFAKRHTGETEIPMAPYYLTLDLIQEDRLDFLLFLPMLPEGRDNMRAMVAAGSDDPYYGELLVYSFPKGELVFGPTQITTVINEDPSVSAQFTLWNQEKSEVILGDMVIMPVGQAILYIQPVFLTFEGEVKIPELQRIILSDGQYVVMEPTLLEAYVKLKERIEEEGENI